MRSASSYRNALVRNLYLTDRRFRQLPPTPIQQLAVSAEQTLANHLDSRSPQDIERSDVMSN